MTTKAVPAIRMYIIAYAIKCFSFLFSVSPVYAQTLTVSVAEEGLSWQRNSGESFHRIALKLEADKKVAEGTYELELKGAFVSANEDCRDAAGAKLSGPKKVLFLVPKATDDSIRNIEAEVLYFLPEKLPCGENDTYLNLGLKGITGQVVWKTTDQVVLIQAPKSKQEDSATASDNSNEDKSKEKEEKEAKSYTHEFMTDDGGRYLAMLKEENEGNLLSIASLSAMGDAPSKEGDSTAVNQIAGPIEPEETNAVLQNAADAPLLARPDEVRSEEPEEGQEADSSSAPEGAEKKAESPEPKKKGVKIYSISNRELFKQAFKEAYTAEIGLYGLDGLDQLDTHAEAFFTRIEIQKENERKDVAKNAYAKGLKAALDSIENEVPRPAGILKIRQEEVAVYSDHEWGPSIGTMAIESVTIDTRNSVIDQVCVTGKVSIDQEAYAAATADDEKTDEKEKGEEDKKDEKAFNDNKEAKRKVMKASAIVINKQYSLSLHAMDANNQWISGILELSPDKSVQFWVPISSVLDYLPTEGKALKFKVRDDEFTLTKEKPTKELSQRRLTDYLSASLLSDVLGLTGDAPNSLLQTRVKLDFPINVHNYRCWTFVPRVEISAQLARLENNEQFVHVKKFTRPNEPTGRQENYLSIFDQLEFFNTLGYVGLTFAELDVKPIDTRFRLIGGGTIWRTGVEFDDRGGRDSTINIWTPAVTAKASAIISPAKHIGLELSYSVHYAAPQKLDSLSYTSEVRPAFDDGVLQRDLRTRSSFFIGQFGFYAYYEANSGSKLYADLRAFDTYRDRNTYMMFLVGYAVPLSTILPEPKNGN